MLTTPIREGEMPGKRAFDPIPPGTVAIFTLESDFDDGKQFRSDAPAGEGCVNEANVLWAMTNGGEEGSEIQMGQFDRYKLVDRREEPGKIILSLRFVGTY